MADIFPINYMFFVCIQHSNVQAFTHEEINMGAFSHVCVVPIFMGAYKHTVIVLIQMVQLVNGLKVLWYHSYLWFAFEGSIHTCTCFLFVFTRKRFL